MYNSQTTSNDLNLSFPAAFKHEKVEFHKTREAMASDLCHQQQLNSSLMRFRSAPSTLLANFMDDDFLPRSTSPEAETMFARFMSCGGGDSASPNLHEIGEKPSAAAAAAAASQRNSQFITGIEHEAEVVPQQNGFASASQMMYQTNPLPNHSSATVAGIESSYRNPLAVDTAQVKSSSNCSNLIRHSSSPAGLFANLTVENGYGVMRGMGSFRGGNGINGETTASASRFKNQMSLLSRQASSPGQMSQISEMGSESLGGSSPDDGSLGNANGTGRVYIPGGFPISSWDDSSLENFTGVKRVRDVNGKIISSLNPSEAQQNGEAGNQSHGLTHQFSLPKTSSEMAAVEKFLQFQDSVPCKIRAKRGCATHPRSIAERVRRTRISERMRKLQELVPNMDKQTNTADMLDLAVEYIKDLQRQVKTFSDNRASCSCPSKPKPY
ncbi:hypothetical protein MRB53_012321 [Persea americana]|uniref:Uncharacterized protein n=1 Tax=Persea americana TaxID=3435 RepID=A0ACC2LYE6_PERAE|nr:hypothetical protein MRB53_012321 [Persea americana]